MVEATDRHVGDTSWDQRFGTHVKQELLVADTCGESQGVFAEHTHGAVVLHVQDACATPHCHAKRARNPRLIALAAVIPTQMASAAARAAAALDPNIVDTSVFGQLLEMDDDDDVSFSKSLVADFFGQARDTFAQIRAALAQCDAARVAQLGHFLKGSSAALGLVRLRATCECIQNVGSLRPATSGAIAPANPEAAVLLLTPLLEQAEADFAEGRTALLSVYGGSVD